MKNLNINRLLAAVALLCSGIPKSAFAVDCDTATYPSAPRIATGVCWGAGPNFRYRIAARCKENNGRQFLVHGAWKNNSQQSRAQCPEGSVVIQALMNTR